MGCGKGRRCDERVEQDVANTEQVGGPVQLMPAQHRMLEDYARIYAQSYGEEIAPATLVPSMLASFLASDNGFKKARKLLAER